MNCSPAPGVTVEGTMGHKPRSPKHCRPWSTSQHAPFFHYRNPHPSFPHQKTDPTLKTMMHGKSEEIQTYVRAY
jgi:hypothetical protein